jgi:hypothetical protein
VVARSGERVPGTGYTWHDAPDGGAVLPDGAGWIYVSNSGTTPGGAGAIVFNGSGEITGARRVLTGTQQNSAGGATPWRTWLSGEKTPLGSVHECYPCGSTPARALPALGRFRHEAAAVDPEREVVYLTEDADNGRLYRFVPTRWTDLAAGVLQVLIADEGDSGSFGWARVADPSGASAPTRTQVPGAKAFSGGAGLHYAENQLWITTKGDNRVRRLDLAANTYSIVYDGRAAVTPLSGVNDLTRASSGDLFVAEDGGNMEICSVAPDGQASVFLRVVGQGSSSLTGPAFAPSGDRLYFSSTRGTSTSGTGGITYEITGPFRS